MSLSKHQSSKGLPERRSLFRAIRSVLPLTAIPIIMLISATRSTPIPTEGLTLTARLSTRTLTVRRGAEPVREYSIAVGSEHHPTPTGTFTIRKIVWNPSWTPPDRAWARDKRPQDPGEPDNPMKMVKLYFHEPDFYIHGTGAVGSLGSAASHGCLRMDPDQAGELGLMVMDNGGVSRDWDWVKGILHLGEERTVSLQRPAPLTILP
jgi:murein L,D-transpeptidase YcbB/YkuD